MKRLIAWARRNPKLALMMMVLLLMPVTYFINYLLLITGVITVEEFVAITGAMFPFLKTFMIL